MTGKSALFETGAEQVTYTVTRDPTAAPKDLPDDHGVELRQGESILFRGCILTASHWTVAENSR